MCNRLLPPRALLISGCLPSWLGDPSEAKPVGRLSARVGACSNGRSTTSPGSVLPEDELTPGGSGCGPGDRWSFPHVTLQQSRDAEGAAGHGPEVGGRVRCGPALVGHRLRHP